MTQTPEKPALHIIGTGGFSLVELMVVVGIVAILATLGVQGTRYYHMKARDAVSKGKVDTVETYLRSKDPDKPWPGNPNPGTLCTNVPTSKPMSAESENCLPDLLPSDYSMGVLFKDEVEDLSDTVTYYNYPTHGPVLFIQTETPTPTPCCVDEGNNICRPDRRSNSGKRSYCVCLFGDPGQSDSECTN